MKRLTLSPNVLLSLRGQTYTSCVCVEEKHQQFKCVEVRTIFGQDKSKDQVRSRERTLHLQFLILRPFISVMDYKDPQDVNFLLLLSICLHFSFFWTLFSYYLDSYCPSYFPASARETLTQGKRQFVNKRPKKGADKLRRNWVTERLGG